MSYFHLGAEAEKPAGVTSAEVMAACHAFMGSVKACCSNSERAPGWPGTVHMAAALEAAKAAQ